MHSGNSQVVNKNYVLIIAAAGSGKRMGLDEKKQFLQYKGQPLYMASVLVGENTSCITDIIIVTAQSDLEKIKSDCQRLELKKVRNIISGGKERQDSIYNALKVCEASYIAVHDGARPFIEGRYLEDALEALKRESSLDGIVIGVKVKDTVKKVSLESNKIESTPNRETLYLAQTPQVFRSQCLKDAYENAKNEGYLGTDDSSLVERYGGHVKILEGSYKNIKVTTEEDLYFLEEVR